MTEVGKIRTALYLNSDGVGSHTKLWGAVTGTALGSIAILVGVYLVLSGRAGCKLEAFGSLHTTGLPVGIPVLIIGSALLLYGVTGIHTIRRHADKIYSHAPEKFTITVNNNNKKYTYEATITYETPNRVFFTGIFQYQFNNDPSIRIEIDRTRSKWLRNVRWYTDKNVQGGFMQSLCAQDVSGEEARTIGRIFLEQFENSGYWTW